MRRILAFAVAALMLCAALASCKTTDQSAPVSSNIRTTSSDAASAAKWLTERLGDRLADRVVLGTDANGWGVDVSSLEDDGYIIRRAGEETLLFARSADGLDRAVRRYAKAAEAGVPIADETFHEGFRIKRIEIAGRDVSEYTIFVPDNDAMKNAADILAQHIEKACGATVPVSTDEAAAPSIVLKYGDDAFDVAEYRWSVDGSGLLIEISPKYADRMPYNAIYRFIQKAFHWDFLSLGYEYLQPADLFSLPIGENGGESAAFEYNMIGSGDMYGYDDRFTSYNMFTSYETTIAPYRHACHGIVNNRIAADLSENPGENAWHFDQPCYLDETFFEYSYQDVIDLIGEKIKAGQVIGKDLFFIDIAQTDTSRWCKCKDCTAMFIAEGYTHAGEVLTWSNRISEAVDKVYPGLSYGVFAYMEPGTSKPPKTIRPNKLLRITFCFDECCSLHPLDSSRCTTGDPLTANLQKLTVKEGRSNRQMCEYFRAWSEMTENMYVWFYALTNGLLPQSFTGQVRENVKTLHDLGAKGFYWEADDSGWSDLKAARLMCAELIWNLDMSDEEYEAYYDKVLENLYGDAAPYMKECFALETSIYDHSACAFCWGWSYGIHPSINADLWKRYYDVLFDLSERARTLANDARQEYRLTKYGCTVIYKGSLSSYFDAYNAFDEERLAELRRRYALIDERLTSYGIDMTARGGVDKVWGFGTSKTDDGTYERDLDTMAWTRNWVKFAHMIGKYPTREKPDLTGGN